MILELQSQEWGRDCVKHVFYISMSLAWRLSSCHRPLPAGHPPPTAGTVSSPALPLPLLFSTQAGLCFPPSNLQPFTALPDQDPSLPGYYGHLPTLSTQKPQRTTAWWHRTDMLAANFLRHRKWKRQGERGRKEVTLLGPFNFKLSYRCMSKSLKCRAGWSGQKTKSQYYLAEWRFTVHISQYFLHLFY